MLENLTYEVKRIRTELKNLQRPSLSVMPDNNESPSPTEFSFPIRNVEELEKMEALANVPEVKLKMVR